MPLYDDLGSHGYAVTTRAPLAQRYFDQGLRLYYAFNHAEAERAFREELERFPENGWSLRGLARSLRGQGREAEAAAAEARFRAAWSQADADLREDSPPAR